MSLSASLSISNNTCTDACAINNMGVSMLQRGHFESAARTLKDALHIMKLSRPNNNGKTRQQQQQQQQQVQAFAQERLQYAASLFASITSCAKDYVTVPDSPNWLNVVENNDFTSLKEAVTEGKPFSAVLIRNMCQETGNDMETALILYNYGLSCYVLMEAKRIHPALVASNINTELCLSIAYQSLVLAHGVFSRREDKEDVLFQVMNLTCIQRVLSIIGDDVKAGEVGSELDSMYIALERDEKCLAPIPVDTNSLAAAA